MKSKSILKHSLTLLLTFQLVVISKLFAQNIAINTTGNRPDTSAMLDVNSTSLGFLAPRMTTVQMNAIILPATGLLIYNTSLNVFEVNIGTTSSPNWVPISTSQTGWSTTGNAGTNSNTNFLGTTDNTSLYLRTNNQNWIKIDSIGEIGIDNPAPSQALDVTGNVQFSGALMPNSSAGTAGQMLTSAGPGSTPTWTTFSASKTYARTSYNVTSAVTNTVGMNSTITSNSTAITFKNTGTGTGTSTNLFSSNFTLTTAKAVNFNISAGIDDVGGGAGSPYVYFYLEVYNTSTNAVVTGSGDGSPLAIGLQMATGSNTSFTLTSDVNLPAGTYNARLKSYVLASNSLGSGTSPYPMQMGFITYTIVASYY